MLNPGKLRDELQKTETEIKSLVGPRKENDWVDIPDDIDRTELEKLLHSRRYCLDMLFRKDPKGVERFRKVNCFLKELSDKMFSKGAKVYRQYIASGMDEEFDDDFMIDADLRFIYNGDESIAILGDEEYYGSDFSYMMNVIYDFCKDAPLAGSSYSKSFRKTDTLDMSDRELELYNRYDDLWWNEMEIWIPELAGIKICNAVNEICVYNKYSAADLLRMNDFWCEVKAVYQHICDRNGKRYIGEY